MPTPRRPTIRDVARAAGVSEAAVSKVTHNAYGVSAVMRERVQAAIASLGYRPRLSARAMRMSTRTIGVALPSMRGPFFADIVDGIQEKLNEHDFRMIVALFDHETRSSNPGMESLLDRSVDGIVAISPTVDRAWLEDFSRQVPLVVIARHDGVNIYDTVADDDHAGATLIVDHLVALGHRRISHISHAVGEHHRDIASPHAMRLDAYLEAMKRHGLAEFIDVVTAPGTESDSALATSSMLARSTPPSALFVGSDLGAFGSLRAVAETGLSAPRDISIAGYDDTRPASHPLFSLTSVDQQGREMGSAAARMLVERINGRTEAVQWMALPRLVARLSTGQYSSGG